MSLWIFGCSFSVSQPAGKSTHPTWANILAEKMKLTEFHDYAQWGVSNEYIVDQFMKVNNEIQPGDTIIIQLTEKSRQWFFKDQPCIANFYIADLNKYISKKQHQAVKMYIEYLDRDESQDMRYALTCMALQHVSTVMSSCRIMILPGFSSVPGATGSLLSVCNGEFKSDDSRNKWYENYRIDIRANHMSEVNHYILAEKIFHTFNTGSMLDLTSGFQTGFL